MPLNLVGLEESRVQWSPDPLRKNASPLEELVHGVKVSLPLVETLRRGSAILVDYASC